MACVGVAPLLRCVTSCEAFVKSSHATRSAPNSRRYTQNASINPGGVLMTRFTSRMATFLFPIVTAAAQSGANVYVQHNLISDIPGMADLTDPNLIDPWGLSFST